MTTAKALTRVSRYHFLHVALNWSHCLFVSKLIYICALSNKCILKTCQLLFEYGDWYLGSTAVSQRSMIERTGRDKSALKASIHHEGIVFMMTSSNGNIFRVTGHLRGEFTGPRWIPAQRPVTRSFDVFFDLRLNKRLSKQSWGWWFETLSRPLWRHCNVTGIRNPVITLRRSSVIRPPEVYNGGFL